MILVSVYMFVCLPGSKASPHDLSVCMFVCLSRFVNTVSLHPDGNCIGGGTTDSVVKVYTVHVFKNDAALRKPFPLLRRDCAANETRICLNAATEVLNAAPEDTNAAHEKP